MGAAISSTLSLGITYCCASVTGSLCNSCLGSTAAGTTGRKRSVLLLTIATAVALYFQYVVGPAIVSQSGTVWKMYRWVPGVGKWVYASWHDDCAAYDLEDHSEQKLMEQCAGNAGVYRPTAVATLFFAVSAIATRFQPHLNREAWPAKYGIFFFAVLFTMFLSSGPLFTGIYLWLARVGAALFLILQQIILIDVAYNWNEDWVDRADQADRLVYGTGGSTWLRAIVATCAAFYIAVITGIAILYKYFGENCPANNWIITLTLLGIVALTAIQLSGSEGSLLTSSIMSLYVTYLAYSMVSKNPAGGTCNPTLGNNDVWGICIGLFFTAVSLGWTGWSWTAEDRLNVDGVQSARTVTVTRPNNNDGQVNLDVPFLDPDEQPTQGLVMDADATGQGNSSSSSSSTSNAGCYHVWKLNVVMALISCFVAMTLTGWGFITRIDYGEDGTGTSAANPTVGRVNMAMIGISQWLAILLYTWTLAAPRLFPDRDFS